jgi:predicted Ser/Thr protein kinase
MTADEQALEIDRVADAFERAWQGESPPAIDDFLGSDRVNQQQLLVELVQIDLEQRLRRGQAAHVEQYLVRYPQLASSVPCVLSLASLEYRLRSALGEQVDVEQFVQRFPDHAVALQDQLRRGGAISPSAATSVADSQCDESLNSTAVRRSKNPQPAPALGGPAPPFPHAEPPDDPVPDKIGRYEVRRRLGAGKFGVVYLARDTELDRSVAVKVQRRRAFTPEETAMFRQESRIVAQLEHPHIVPVFDTGQLDDGRRYVVSKLIDGVDLAHRVVKQRLSHDQSASLVATVAEALHYAHRQRLVHRDIKPANILVDKADTPYVCDFGLALTEDDYGDTTAPQGGTPLYMSPEQARREGHLIDGRSDIFSLGVVLYELLTGERPFTGKTVHEVREMGPPVPC